MWDQHLLTLVEIVVATLTGVSIILEVSRRRNKKRQSAITQLATSVQSIGTKMATLVTQVEVAKSEVMGQVTDRMESFERETRGTHEAMRTQIDGNQRTLQETFISHREFSATMNGLFGSIAELRNDVAHLTSRLDTLMRDSVRGSR